MESDALSERTILGAVSILPPLFGGVEVVGIAMIGRIYCSCGVGCRGEGFNASGQWGVVGCAAL
jgi:hypothetical protein